MKSDFGTILKELRIENNLSQSALAAKINCSQKIIDYWEKGSSEPTAHFIIALADFFGVSCDYLLGREDDFGTINSCDTLTFSENELVTIYRDLSAADKKTVMLIAKSIKQYNSRNK